MCGAKKVSSQDKKSKRLIPTFILSFTMLTLCSVSADNWSDHHQQPCSHLDRRQKLGQPQLRGPWLHQHHWVDEGQAAAPSEWEGHLLRGQQDGVPAASSQLPPRHLPVSSQQPSQHRDCGPRSHCQLWVRLTQITWENKQDYFQKDNCGHLLKTLKMCSKMCLHVISSISSSYAWQ